MRRALASVAVLAICLVVAAPAGAAGPTLRSLQKQITVLKKQVATLKKREAVDRNLVIGSFVYTGCGLAVTADAFQNTWTTVNPSVFGPQTPVNDYETCQAIPIVRARTQVPPNTGVFQALLDSVFKPSASSALREMGMNLAGQVRHLFGQFFVLPR
jgi:hypothetical protein